MARRLAPRLATTAEALPPPGTGASDARRSVYDRRLSSGSEVDRDMGSPDSRTSGGAPPARASGSDGERRLDRIDRLHEPSPVPMSERQLEPRPPRPDHEHRPWTFVDGIRRRLVPDPLDGD